MNDPKIIKLNDLHEQLFSVLYGEHILNASLKGNKDIRTLLCNKSLNTHLDFYNTQEDNTRLEAHFLKYFNSLETFLSTVTLELLEQYKTELFSWKRN